MSEVVAVVRIRGRTHIRPQISDAMKYMGLTRKNHCTLLKATSSNKRLIQKIKDYVTFGPVDEKTVESLLAKRGRVAGWKQLTDDYVKSNSKYGSVTELSAAISAGEAKLKDVEGMKTVFRLNPPSKGFERKGIKLPFSVGGALGSRGDKMNDLVRRMI